MGVERWERAVRADRRGVASVAPCEQAGLTGRHLQDGCPTCGHVVVVHRVLDHVCSVCELIADIGTGDPLVAHFRAELRDALAAREPSSATPIAAYRRAAPRGQASG